MASIRKKTKKNGDVAYYADIVIKRGGVIVHREGRTFLKKSLAKAWSSGRELELQKNEVFGKRKVLFIRDIIQDYLDNFQTGLSKRNDMRRLQRYDIAGCDVYRLTAADIIAHCRFRNAQAKPQTVKNDVIWLRVALSTVKGFRNYDYSLDVFSVASRIMSQEGITASSDVRDRRPSQAELAALSRYFYRKKAAYLHVMWFAIFSARRLGEICSLQWEDINHVNHTVFVRDIKSPGKKVVSLWAKLPRSAYRLIMRQPKGSRFIFPMNSRTVSSNFTRACKILCIDDLHFHDLRREAASRLFEQGLSINQVAQVTLHQNWSTLKIYTKENPGDLDI